MVDGRRWVPMNHQPSAIHHPREGGARKLQMYRVRDLMTRRVLFVTPQATVQAAMDLLRLQQLETLPVVQDGVLIGVLDSLSLYRFHGELPVREAMTEPLTTEP